MDAKLAGILHRSTSYMDHRTLLAKITSPLSSYPEALFTELSSTYNHAYQKLLFPDAWHMLDQCLAHSDPEAVRPIHTGHWPPFEPQEERSPTGATRRIIEDKSLLAHHIPEIHL